MEILMGVTCKDRVLRLYWGYLLVLAQAGKYYGATFQGLRERTHGYPLSPTIFNMVLDAVICCWFMLVLVEEAVPDGFGWAVQWPEALFYVDDGLLASPRPFWIQLTLDILMGMFDRLAFRLT